MLCKGREDGSLSVAVDSAWEGKRAVKKCSGWMGMAELRKMDGGLI